jgi:hypothetical protein
VSVLCVACGPSEASRPPSDPSAAQGDDVAGDTEGDEPPVRVERASATAGNGAEPFLAEVDHELASVKSSTYAHHLHVDEAAGVFDYDCSGFAVYVLGRAVPDALAALQRSTPRRPRSQEIVDFVATIPPGGTRGRWMRVARVADLEPGDIAAWLKPADSTSKNTGHTVIVHGAVTPAAGEPGAFVVPVADSTSKPHVPGDTRLADHATGLGRGEIILVAGADGAPVAYRWSRGAKSGVKPTTIVLARLR